MKRFAFLLSLLPSLLIAQTAETPLQVVGQNTNWLLVPPEASVSPTDFFAEYGEQLGLTSHDDMRMEDRWSDEAGFTHYRYNQFHNGIRVEGAQYLLHAKGDRVEKVNGRLIVGLIPASPEVAGPDAIERAKEHIKAAGYLWQDEAAEQQLKRIRNDQNATYYPAPELVFVDRHFSRIGAHHELAWKVELHTTTPLGRYDVYVNAADGSIYHVINKSHFTNVPGVAETKYSGTQSFITDSVGVGQFRLRDSSRGISIETYDMNEEIDYGLAEDFWDTDNVWDTTNAQQDEAATDAHWGMQATYDYFLQDHGRNSLDDSGMAMISYVHFDQNYSNAFWNGSFMTYGDGSGNYTAFTALDVVAHEATHGVTEFSANLIYQDESGALNESFSDIFGAAVEFQATPALADWLIGEDMNPGAPLRSMSNPNLYGDPDTYLGTNWATGPFDNGGVHTNSGVQNFWFYILAEGDSGVNDNGHSYAVAGLGLDTAAAIAYRNLTTYLTIFSEYEDARLGAIQAAEDLYGPCSDAVAQTSAAWHAVGVGFGLSDYDLWTFDLVEPATACGLSSAEPITVRLRHNACNNSISTGDTIPMAYRVDGGAVVVDTIFTTSPVSPSDTITFTFAETADLSTVGAHTIDVWCDYRNDPQPFNDSLLSVEVTHILQQNVDVGVIDVVSPTSHCDLTSAETVQLLLEFYGCDSLPGGTVINVGYRVNGGPHTESSYTLPQTALPGIPFMATVSGPADLASYGQHTIDAWTAFASDFLNSNDTLLGLQIEKPFDIGGQWIGFEAAAAVRDSFYEIIGDQAAATTHPSASSTGNLGFRMTGGDALSFVDSIEGIPDGTNNFDINDIFGAKACFCVEAATWPSVHLQFDLKQTFSPAYEFAFNEPLPDASSFRVLVNDVQIGSIYIPTTETSDPFVTHHVGLNSFAGTDFELCFESRCYFHPGFDPVAPIGQGDQAKLDNIFVSPYPVGMEQLGNAFHVFPNPTDGSVSIRFRNETKGHVVLVNLLGAEIWSSPFAGTSGQLTIPGHISGLFWLQAIGKDGLVVGSVPLIVR